MPCEIPGQIESRGRRSGGGPTHDRRRARCPPALPCLGAAHGRAVGVGRLASSPGAARIGSDGARVRAPPARRPAGALSGRSCWAEHAERLRLGDVRKRDAVLVGVRLIMAPMLNATRPTTPPLPAAPAPPPPFGELRSAELADDGLRLLAEMAEKWDGELPIQLMPEPALRELALELSEELAESEETVASPRQQVADLSRAKRGWRPSCSRSAAAGATFRGRSGIWRCGGTSAASRRSRPR